MPGLLQRRQDRCRRRRGGRPQQLTAESRTGPAGGHRWRRRPRWSESAARVGHPDPGSRPAGGRRRRPATTPSDPAGIQPGDGRRSRSFSAANRMRSSESSHPSFRWIRVRWVSTVFIDMPSCPAMVALPQPRTSRSNTSRSRRDRPPSTSATTPQGAWPLRQATFSAPNRRKAGATYNPPVPGQPDRLQQLLGGVGLEGQTIAARRQHVHGVPLPSPVGHQQDRQARRPAPQLPDGLGSPYAQLGHVDHQRIGPIVVDVLEAPGTIARAPYPLHVLGGFDERLETEPKDWIPGHERYPHDSPLSPKPGLHLHQDPGAPGKVRTYLPPPKRPYREREKTPRRLDASYRPSIASLFRPKKPARTGTAERGWGDGPYAHEARPDGVLMVRCAERPEGRPS